MMTACDVGVPRWPNGTGQRVRLAWRRPGFDETTEQCKDVTDQCNPVAVSVRSRYTWLELACSSP
jgi:hypothetical protein